MSTSEAPRPPFPPFDPNTATQKVRLAEDAWNTRDPVRVSLAYTPDSVWRNRSEFFAGREAIVQFLIRKWNKELDYRLIKELWTFWAAVCTSNGGSGGLGGSILFIMLRCSRVNQGGRVRQNYRFMGNQSVQSSYLLGARR